MVRTLVARAGRAAEAAGSVLGLRFFTEKPAHSTQKLPNGVEIRSYGPRIAAETTVVADEEAARSTGFRRLAGYIFGDNHSGTTIAMTAPVAQQQGTKIAMTAPVAQQQEADGGSVIRFFMPAEWSMDTLPVPNDSQVRLVPVPPQTYAVLRFSGDRRPNAVAARTAELLTALQATETKPTGTPVAWFYDPPWTLPFRRRNEVAVPVD
jgi:SOUL heme-binding protein